MRLAKAMNNPDCIFCQIAVGTIPKAFTYQDDEYMVFPDIHPLAPTHLLIIPKDHCMRSVAEMEPDQQGIVTRMIVLAKKMAEESGVDKTGYRLVFNARHHSGQEVDHIHLHLLGGAMLGPVA